MSRYLTSAVAVCAFAGAITVLAQEPPAQQPAQQQQQQAAPAPATVTGCVQEAKTTDGGTAFVLKDAEGGTAKMYLLVPQASADMTGHVNHKVEVVGQVQEPTPLTADEAAKANPNVLRPPSIRVETVKMIAETCK